MLTVDLTSVALGEILTDIAKENKDQVIQWLEKLSVVIETGVESVGPPSQYALVWEWGNSRQTKKGPKTTRGINPDGKRVWLTIQAPKGWIAINEQRIWEALAEEVGKIEFKSPADITAENLKQELTEAYIRISERALELLQSTVPIDSGDLYDSLKVVPPNDEILEGISEFATGVIGTLEDIGL